MKDQLIFDTTDANTIADSDSIGAFLRSSDGTLLTHSNVSGKDALDVNIMNDIDVNLDAATDSVAIGDGTDLLGVNADGSINVIATATDLDIRDLDSATDSVASWLSDGSGNAITSTTGSLDVNISNTNLSVNDAALADTAIVAGAETLAVASTAQDVVASPLANRKYLYIYNNDNRKMYVGQSGVTSSNGFPVSPGSYLELRAGASIDVEYVSPKLAHEIRHMEIS